MNFPAYDLYSQFISSSYDNLVQTYTSSSMVLYLLDAHGNVVTNVPQYSTDKGRKIYWDISGNRVIENG